MWMSKTLWNTGKVVTIDSGFSVSKEFHQCRRRECLGSISKAKRKMLTCFGSCDEYFNEELIGHCKTQEVDSVKFLIHCQKVENYMTIPMPCHWDFTRVDDHKTFHSISNADGSRLRIQFKILNLFHTPTEPSIGQMNQTIADTILFSFKCVEEKAVTKLTKTESFLEFDMYWHRECFWRT